jgi:hypothetical protein
MQWRRGSTRAVTFLACASGLAYLLIRLTTLGSRTVDDRYLGRSRDLDRSTRKHPTLHQRRRTNHLDPQGTALLSGSMALRTGLLPTGQNWYIDDARGRKLITPEPSTTIVPLDRN